MPIYVLDHVFQLISNTPLLMANCQFKALRENTLHSDSLKETHARQIQLNPFGGLSGQKNVKFEQLKQLENLDQLVPKRIQQKIVAANTPEPEDKIAIKEARKEKKEKIKKVIKELFKTNVSCDLVRTYNPPNIPKQPSTTK